MIGELRVRLGALFAGVVHTQTAAAAELSSLYVQIQVFLFLVEALFENKSHRREVIICTADRRWVGVRHCFSALRGSEFRVGSQPYVVVRGLTEVWELKGEGPCWKGLGLWLSGVAGEVLGHTRPTGWMAPGLVWRKRNRY